MRGGAPVQSRQTWIHPPDYRALLVADRKTGDCASEKTTTSSPVIVLMSWCMLTGLEPVMSLMSVSSAGFAISISWVLTCFSRSRPFSGGSVDTRFCSAEVKTPCSRTTNKSPIRCARMSFGPRPMRSCSNRDIPSQTAASISPCVLIDHLPSGRAILKCESQIFGHEFMNDAVNDTRNCQPIETKTRSRVCRSPSAAPWLQPADRFGGDLKTTRNALDNRGERNPIYYDRYSQNAFDFRIRNDSMYRECDHCMVLAHSFMVFGRLNKSQASKWLAS